MEQKPKILIKHSRIEISDYDLGDAPQLEYLFSVWDAITHSQKFKAFDYNIKEKLLKLPRGMDIDALANVFMTEPVVDKVSDPFVDSDPIPIKYLAKDDRQVEILKFILGEGQYLYTKKKSQLSINSATGSGKTYVTVASLCVSGARAIIITNNVGWLNQWKDRILEYTNLKESDIYMMVGKSAIDKILARDDAIKYRIFLASHSTIRSYGDTRGWDTVQLLFKKLQVRMKIFDEAHLYFDNLAKIDYNSNTKKTLYLTATPQRSSKEEDLIYQEYFKNIPSIELFDKENDPHVNYVSMMFKSHPSPYDIRNFSKGQFGFDRNTYTRYLVSSPNFLKLVTLIIDMCLNIPGKILIYIGTNEAIVQVVNYIYNEFPFLVGHVGIYTSITDKDLKDDNLKKKFIISTTKSCGAASDIKHLAATVVLAEPFKSLVLARQTLGRCRDDNTLYIDVVDASCYRTKIYNKSKRNTFMEYAKTCKEIWVEDDSLDRKYNAIHEKYSKYKVMFMEIFKE